MNRVVSGNAGRAAISGLVFLLLLVPAAGEAQTEVRVPAVAARSWDAGRLQLTRAQLEELLATYEQARRGSGYSDAFKARAAAEADLIRTRLSDGDFQPGDQIHLAIEGEYQDSVLTVTVAPGRLITIAGMGDLSLGGVLRSELNTKVREFVGRFIREPVVHTRSLIRITVTGQVQSPGFHAVPAESLLSDAIMIAGGPTTSAKLTATHVERGGERIWEGRALQNAIEEGRTLDQMSVRSGDQLVVPAERSGAGGVPWVFTVVPTTLVAIIGLIRAF